MRALKFSSHRAFNIGEVTIHTEGTNLKSGDMTVELSQQERAVLCLLLQHRGTCVPRDALSYAARGKPAGSSRAIDMHISNIRKKIAELNGGVQDRMISSVRGAGYILSV